jgi:2-phosphosulfolactate phosphatase
VAGRDGPSLAELDRVLAGRSARVDQRLTSNQPGHWERAVRANHGEGQNSTNGEKSSMKVVRKSLLSGAQSAEGIVVVIDVLRAFTCSALMFHYGIEELVLVKTPQEALEMRAKDPRYLVAGEVKGIKVDGFDLGNSPKDIVELGEPFFRGRKVVLRSSAGTQGVLAASATAQEVILGNYLTASAIAKYLRAKDSGDLLVTVLAMGFQAEQKSVEDEVCGDYIEHLLTGRPYDHLAAIWTYLTHPYVATRLRGEVSFVPREDVVLAIQRDLFSFVLVGKPACPHVVVRRIDV